MYYRDPFWGVVIILGSLPRFRRKFKL